MHSILQCYYLAITACHLFLEAAPPSSSRLRSLASVFILPLLCSPRRKVATMPSDFPTHHAFATSRVLRSSPHPATGQRHRSTHHRAHRRRSLLNLTLNCAHRESSLPRKTKAAMTSMAARAAWLAAAVLLVAPRVQGAWRPLQHGGRACGVPTPHTTHLYPIAFRPPATPACVLWPHV